ncbi:hypothetical protein LXL04_016619 [Taraxacum kok-saghyz]
MSSDHQITGRSEIGEGSSSRGGGGGGGGGGVVVSAPAPPQQLSRYESQKRRDWNTFGQYLKNQRPPVALSHCSYSHVLDFLRYLDQFGKTKVHLQGCVFFGHPDPAGPCTCPLRQAWGSLDALIGRLRAAYEENGGLPEMNPFASGAIRVYLREIRDSQAKARGIPYKKKKKKKNTPIMKANEETSMFESFENLYISRTSRTPPIFYISQTVIHFKKPTSIPSKTTSIKFETYTYAKKQNCKICTYAKTPKPLNFSKNQIFFQKLCNSANFFFCTYFCFFAYVHISIFVSKTLKYLKFFYRSPYNRYFNGFLKKI